jgi:uncharacterized membrane protein
MGGGALRARPLLFAAAAAFFIGAASGLAPGPSTTRAAAAAAAPSAKPWIRTAARVRIDAPVEVCFFAYADLTRMPEWCPMLAEVAWTNRTLGTSEWRMGYKGISVGWTAENLEVAPPSLLRWTSRAGVPNHGAASFAAAGAAACDCEVAISYQMPRVLSDIVETPRVQRFISRLLERTLLSFGRTMKAEHAGAAAGNVR